MTVMYSKLLTALEIFPIVTEEYITFADADQIKSYANSAIQLMYKLKILNGEGNIIDLVNR